MHFMESKVIQLRTVLRDKAGELTTLLEDTSGRSYEDDVYRFYHQSFKVFGLQERTEEMVAALQSLLPGQLLNEWFLKIVREGTGKEFSADTNDRWLQETRPILEAFFHARYFLEMACRCSHISEKDLTFMPAGWAGLLYLFNLR